MSQVGPMLPATTLSDADGELVLLFCGLLGFACGTKACVMPPSGILLCACSGFLLGMQKVCSA